jgi:hypothetical protein
MARRNPLDLNVEDSPTTNKQVLRFLKSFPLIGMRSKIERERETTVSDFLFWGMIAHRLWRSRFE